MLDKVISIVFICFPYFSLGFTADEVTHLPGLAKPLNFKHYSGYLNASKGRYHHYWFVESQSNPQKDPVILWLEGGRSVSALEAFFKENGPFRVDSNGKNVSQDPHSWNTIANVLYLESPVGVGYSYSDNNDNNSSDDLTAEDNYLSLQSFFKKFPQFSRNEFYMIGESQAGVYIPMLAIKIFENKSLINLKGLAIANGFFDRKILSKSMLRMAYTHGLIDSYVWKELVDNNCSCGITTRSYCELEPGHCKKLQDELHFDVINIYNYHADCPLSANESSNNAYCGSDTMTHVGYLNDPAVRKAIHIPEHVIKWSIGTLLNYTEQYNSMKTQFKQLISKYRIQSFIVYNGDNNINCDLLGDQQFVDELGYKLIQKYQKWTVGGRVAGFVKRYEGISFMTVRNAGFLVDTDQPLAALQIVRELIGVSKVN